jgi:hypothetical protein
MLILRAIYSAEGARGAIAAPTKRTPNPLELFQIGHATPLPNFATARANLFAGLAERRLFERETGYGVG